MVQQTQPVAQQPTVAAKQPVNQPAAAQPAGQIQPEGGTSVWAKWWFWLIIVVIVAGIGYGIYFLLK